MKPFFIPSRTGSLFSIFYPTADKPITKAIIHIPAFAEEMNKSRRMVALQARAFAAQGHAVLVLDLFGTGDSAGEFAEATWSVWLQNIAVAVEWLKEQGAESIALWGLRTGALLAMDFADKNQYKIERLIAWQPVLNGDTFITQFLRLRVAAAAMDSNAPQEKTSELKQQLLEGITIEVAGYSLNPDLVAPMLGLQANNLNLTNIKNLALFEVVPSKDRGISMVNAAFIESLQSKNQTASAKAVVDNIFWSTQEIIDAPTLLAETSASLS